MSETDTIEYSGSFLERITLQGVFKWAAIITACIFLWSVLSTGTAVSTRGSLGSMLGVGIALIAVVVVLKRFQHPKRAIENYARWAAIAVLLLLTLSVHPSFILTENVLLMYVLLVIGLSPGEKRGY